MMYNALRSADFYSTVALAAARRRNKHASLFSFIEKENQLRSFESLARIRIGQLVTRKLVALHMLARRNRCEQFRHLPNTPAVSVIEHR